MEKRKKNRSGKIAAAFVALTALTCCFVGTTFAKYTSKVEGSGSANVAHWEITGISANSENVYDFSTGGKLSPTLTEEGGKYVNSISADYKISNMSDVGATVTWTIGTETTISTVENAKYNGYAVTWVTDESVGEETSYTGLIYTDTSSGTDVKTKLVSKAEIEEVIQITISAKDKNGTTITETTKDLAAKVEGTDADYITITVSATWTTKTDDIDTLIGMYVKDVTKSLTVTATQNTKLPA